MKKKILIANFHKPFPPRDGADRRCVDLITAFKKLDYQITLFSSDLFQYAPWTKEGVRQVESELGIKVILYIASDSDRKKFRSKARSWRDYVTPGLKNCFDLLYKTIQPEIVLINYVFWADLAIGVQFLHSLNIIDAIDLLSLNQKMAGITVDYLRKGVVDAESKYLFKGVHQELLEEDFFSKRNFKADIEEYEKYDKFDITIAINSSERELIEDNTNTTECIYLPFSFAVNSIPKLYTEPPIFAIGPNQFNFQGYIYFVIKVLPLIRQQRPDFVLNVIGDGCRYLEATEGINLLGFVDDIGRMYAFSKFAVCPLIGATGQQLKVMEAMANGLPVVALRNVAERCPIIHNVNGFIADNNEDFAKYTLLLYSNPDLCQKLGQAAKIKIQQEFTATELLNKLTSAITASVKQGGGRRNEIERLIWNLVFKAKMSFRKLFMKALYVSIMKNAILKVKSLAKN